MSNYLAPHAYPPRRMSLCPFLPSQPNRHLLTSAEPNCHTGRRGRFSGTSVPGSVGAGGLPRGSPWVTGSPLAWDYLRDSAAYRAASPAHALSDRRPPAVPHSGGHLSVIWRTGVEGEGLASREQGGEETAEKGETKRRMKERSRKRRCTVTIIGGLGKEAEEGTKGDTSRGGR